MYWGFCFIFVEMNHEWKVVFDDLLFLFNICYIVVGSRLRHLVATISLFITIATFASEDIGYEYSLTGEVASGSFAPYYMSSLRYGRITQSKTVQAEVALSRGVEKGKRFSYGYGVDLLGGYASSVDYERYNLSDKTWTLHPATPSAFRLQQIYGELKYRSVFLRGGMKETPSAFVNQSLSSGDLVWSGNSRPMPEVRAGFIDFRDIPLTNGWVQIGGEIAYGKMMDNGWIKDHYNYYNSHITTGQYYNYKRCYFRSRPESPLSVTVGMQAAAVFGGETSYYYKGELMWVGKNSSDFKTFLKMFLPYQDGGDGFYTGNHLGSWDMKLRYRLKNKDEVYAYFSWLWEDGSGIGKQNGLDGLWGLEYKSSVKSYLNGIVIEYLDFTNQSGPIHFAPADFPGTTLPGHVSGADDYYNNATFNSYCYYGQSIGTPAMMAPIYNTDGYPAFVGNSLKGVHVGLEGSLSPTLDYRIKGGYRKAWGTSKELLVRPIRCTAMMLEAEWRPERIQGLKLNLSVECDRGTMPGNAFGVMVGVKYNGMFRL